MLREDRKKKSKKMVDHQILAREKSKISVNSLLCLFRVPLFSGELLM